MSSYRAWVYTDLRSTGFIKLGSGPCAPSSPLTIVEFLNGPFSRQPSILSLLSFTGSRVTHSCFRPCFCWCCITVGGGLAFLNKGRICNAFGYIILGLPPAQSLRKNPHHDCKGNREDGTVLSCALGTVNSTPPSETFILDVDILHSARCYSEPDTCPTPL